MVLIPGKRKSAIVSRTLPMPSSSRVPGSLRAEPNFKTALRSLSLLSSQLRVEAKLLAIPFQKMIAYYRVPQQSIQCRRGYG